MTPMPMALGGESITGNSTAIAVLSALSIVGGYVILAALWFFVFRDKDPREKPRRGESQEHTIEPDPKPPHEHKSHISRSRRPWFPRR